MANNKAANIIGGTLAGGLTLSILALSLLSDSADAGPMSKVDKAIKDKAAIALKQDLNPLVDAMKAKADLANKATSEAVDAEKAMKAALVAGVSADSPEYAALFESWLTKQAAAEYAAKAVQDAQNALNTQRNTIINDVNALINARCEKDDGANAQIASLCKKRSEVLNSDN